MKEILDLIPQGLLQSGNAPVLIDPTGAIAVDYELTAGVGFIHKTWKGHVEIKVDPKLLIPANLKVGTKFGSGAVALDVISITKGTAVVSIVIKNAIADIKGQAIVDLTGPLLSVISVQGDGKVSGYEVPIRLQKRGG